MEKKEILKIYALVKILWPNYKFPSNEIEITLHDNTWFELFKEFDIRLVLNVIREYSKKSEFFNAGIIAGKCEEIIKAKTLEGIITEQDIFKEIKLAISSVVNDIEGLEPYKEKLKNANNPYLADMYYKFDRLSPIAKRIVGTPGQLWDMGEIPMAEFETITKSQIFRVAKTLIEKQDQIQTNFNLLETMQNQNFLENQKSLIKNLEGDKK